MVLSVLMTAGTEIVHAADEDVVPDPAIRSYLNGKFFGKSGEALQDPISKTQMETSVDGILALNGRGVESLEGLQYATKVTKLRLNNNPFKSEDLELIKELTGLVELSLVGNSLTDVSALKNLSSLKELYLTNNKIADLSPLKDLNIPTFKTMTQDPEITVSTKTFENPIINKDGSKATITPNGKVTVGEDGKLTVVNFDTLSNGKEVTTTFSGTGDFGGTVTFLIDKSFTPDTYKVNLTQVEGATITTTPAEKVPKDAKVTVNVNVTDNTKILDSIIVKDVDNNNITVTNNTFTMPDKDVTVTATLKAKPTQKYPVKFVRKPFGIKNWDIDEISPVAVGTIVKLTITMHDPTNFLYKDLQIKNKATGELVSIFTPREEVTKPYANPANLVYVHQFIMPEGEVEIQAPKVEGKIYIEKTNGDSETVTTSPEGSAFYNTDVTITATNPSNLESLKVFDQAGNEVAVNNNAFKMPPTFATIKAVYKDAPPAEHNINITQVEGATITTTPADKATKGTEVTVNVDVTDTTKTLDTLIVKDADNNNVTVTSNTFTMPDKDVTVTATLKDFNANDVVPDKSLRLAINTKLGKTGDNLYDPVSKAQVESLTDELIHSNFFAMIKDLSGLEYAKNLNVLKLDIGEISDITPLNNLNLKELSLQSNQIANASTVGTLSKLTTYNLKNQEFIYKATAKIVDNPLRDKDGNVIKINETPGVIENTEDGKIRIVKFDTLNTGAKYTLPFKSTDGRFDGRLILTIDKSTIVEHNITVTSPNGATVTTTPANKAAKDINITVNVTVTDNAKILDKILVDGDVIDGTTFTMPDKDVTVTATLKNKPSNVHNITITNPNGATITTTPATIATTGENVTVTVNVTDDTKVLNKVLVDGQEINGTTFTMPNKDVTVTVTLKAKPGQEYTVDFANKPTGIKSWDTDQPYRVPAGTKVKVKVTMYYPEHYTYRHLHVTNLKTGEVTNIVAPRTEVPAPNQNSLNIAYEHEFIMPEANVKISMHNVEAKIFIEKINGKNATVTTVPEGSQINERPATLVINDPDNKLIKVEITDGSDNPITLNADNTFMMPYKNFVKIKAEFAPDDPETDHNIIVEQVNGATITTNPADKAAKGTNVTVTAIVNDETKTLDKIFVDGVAIDGTTFIMPDKDVKVTATLKDKIAPITKHSITVDEISSATLATEPENEAEEGTEVRMFIKITDSTKKLDRFVVTDADGNEVNVSNDTFKMPNKAVKVSAILTDKDAPTPQEEYSISIYQGTASQYRAKAGDVISVSTVLPSAKFDKWSGNVIFANLNSMTTTFVMPARNVSVKAIEKLTTREVTSYYNTGFPSSGIKYDKISSTETVDLVSKFLIGSQEYIKTVNGIETVVKMDVGPFIKNNRTMVPLRFVGEALGYDVSWEESTRTAILKNKENTVRIPIDSDTFTINGKEHKFDSKPTMKDNRTMLSISNIGYALGLVEGTNIIWEEGTRTVLVKTRVSIPVEKEVPVYTRLQPDRESYTRVVTDPETPFNEVQVLRRQLSQLLEEARKIDSSNASPESVEALNKAISNAEKLVRDLQSSKDALKEGVSALRIAMNSLTSDTPQDPKADLRKLITTAKALEEDKYTPETFGNLKAALINAENVAADNNATPAEIKAAKNVLQNAINNLEIKTDEESEVRQELRGLVEDAEGIDRNLYTPESLKKLDDAVTRANDSLNDPTQDDETVDISVEILKLALINLVKKDDATLKQFTVTEPHGLLNSDFAFAYLVAHDNETTTGLKVFIDGKEIPNSRNANQPGFYVERTIFTNRNDIHLTAGTFKDVGEYKIKLVANGYATKEFTLEMEKFAPRLDIRYGTVIKGVDVPVTWAPGNPAGLEQKYMDNNLVVKVNGERAQFTIPSHKQSLTISKNNFKTNRTYKIELEREGFETKEFTLHVSDLDRVDILSTATTAYQLKDEYTVGAGRDGYINVRFQKIKAHFTDGTFTHLEYITDFTPWGLVFTPLHGYTFEDKDVGDFTVKVSKDGKELGRRIVKVKPRQ